MKDEFLRLTEKFFPPYFCESFLLDMMSRSRRVLEVWLVVSPPSEDKQVTLDSLDKSNEGHHDCVAEGARP